MKKKYLQTVSIIAFVFCLRRHRTRGWAAPPWERTEEEWRREKKSSAVFLRAACVLWSSGGGKLRVMWNCCVSDAESWRVCLVSRWFRKKLRIEKVWTDATAQMKKLKATKGQRSTAGIQVGTLTGIDYFSAFCLFFLFFLSFQYIKNVPLYKRRPIFLKTQPLFFGITSF